MSENVKQRDMLISDEIFSQPIKIQIQTCHVKIGILMYKTYVKVIEKYDGTCDFC